MRCYICNREDDLISRDKVTGEFGPCLVCLAVIEECLDDFQDEEKEANAI